MSLEAHHALHWIGVAGRGRLATSAAVRGHPGPAPGLEPLLAAVPPLSGRVADVSGAAGGGALAASPGADVTVLEPSFAGLRAARAALAERRDLRVEAGLPWDLEARAYDHVLLLPPTDRGSARVRAELRAAAAALRPDGAAYLAMHKDQGGKRYEREAAAAFEDVTVLARTRGWRVARLTGPRVAAADASPWGRVEHGGRSWWALPGVFSQGRLDAGSAALLAALRAWPGRPLEGRSVADLGCGVGVLADAALGLGASSVTALDDDLAAVRSSFRNLDDPRAQVLHADLDDGWDAAARVDAVLMNPPFHLAKDVRLALPRAFLATAARRLTPGGWLLLVANRALPYERELASWSRQETLAESAAFKVLRAWR